MTRLWLIVGATLVACGGGPRQFPDGATADAARPDAAGAVIDAAQADAGGDAAQADAGGDAAQADAARPDATASVDASPDATVDATVDAMPDATVDATVDAMPDATVDATVDAMPTTCIAQVFGDHVLRTDGTTVRYTGGTPPVITIGTTGVPLTDLVEVVDQQWMACGRRSDASVWCWAKTTGGSLSGGLGNGDPTGGATTAYAANQVLLATGGVLDDAIALQRGGLGFYPVPTCAIRADHTLWCWGPKTDGNLMQTGKDEAKAVQIKADATTALTDVAQVALASREACVLAGGVVKCWGANIRGGLAQGDTTARIYPTAIGNPPANPVAVASGQDTNYALAGGVVYAWGASGALGEGTSTAQWTICNANYCQQKPTAVQTSAGVPLDNVATLFAGYLAACAIRTDGTVWCWGLGTGSNSYAQPLIFGGNPVTGVLGLTMYGTGGYDSTDYIKANHHYYRGNFDATSTICGP